MTGEGHCAMHNKLPQGRNNQALMTLFYAAAQHFCAHLSIIVQAPPTGSLCTDQLQDSAFEGVG